MEKGLNGDIYISSVWAARTRLSFFIHFDDFFNFYFLFNFYLVGIQMRWQIYNFDKRSQFFQSFALRIYLKDKKRLL